MCPGPVGHEGVGKNHTTPTMKKTELTPTRLRFTQPLRLTTNTSNRPGIMRPFFETTRRPAGHDMLMLATHPDLLPDPEPAPLRDLNFFNLDRP